MDNMLLDLLLHMFNDENALELSFSYSQMFTISFHSSVVSNINSDDHETEAHLPSTMTDEDL